MSLDNRDFERSYQQTAEVFTAADVVYTADPVQMPPPRPSPSATWRPLAEAPDDGQRVLGLKGIDVATVAYHAGQWRLAVPGAVVTESSPPWTPDVWLPLSALPTP